MYEATSTMYQTMNNEHTNIEIKVKHELRLIVILKNRKRNIFNNKM